MRERVQKIFLTFFLFGWIVCEIERDKGKKTKKYIGRVGEGESATRFNLLFICVSMGFPPFFLDGKMHGETG